MNSYTTNVTAWSNAGNFEVLVNDCQWRITLRPQPLRNGKGQDISYKQFEAVFDGDTIYEVSSLGFPTNILANGQLVRGPVPQRLDARIRHIWLGLASGCYFQKNAQGYLPRLALPPEDPSKYDGFRLQNVNWGYAGAYVHSGIPDWIVYGDAERYGPTGQINQDDPYAYETNILMTVFARTNIGDISIPVSVKVVEFFAQKPSQSTSYSVASVEEETMTNAVIPPELAKRTLFIDRRLTNQATFAPVSFASTNWPSLSRSEKMFAAISKSRRGAALGLQPETKVSKGLVRFLLALIVIVPLLFLWLNRSYKLRNKS